MDFKPRGIINVCVHCGTVCSSMLCASCRKVDDRRAMDEENRRLLNNPSWHVPCAFDEYKRTHPGEPIKKEE